MRSSPPSLVFHFDAALDERHLDLRILGIGFQIEFRAQHPHVDLAGRHHEGAPGILRNRGVALARQKDLPAIGPEAVGIDQFRSRIDDHLRAVGQHHAQRLAVGCIGFEPLARPLRLAVEIERQRRDGQQQTGGGPHRPAADEPPCRALRRDSQPAADTPESPLCIGRRRLRLAQQGIQQFVGLFRFGVFGQPAAGGLLLRGRAIAVEEVSHLFFIHNRLFLPYIRTTGPHCVTGNENQAKKNRHVRRHRLREAAGSPRGPQRADGFASRIPCRRKSATAPLRVAPPHPFSPAPNKKTGSGDSPEPVRTLASGVTPRRAPPQESKADVRPASTSTSRSATCRSRNRWPPRRSPSPRSAGTVPRRWPARSRSSPS